MSPAQVVVRWIGWPSSITDARVSSQGARWPCGASAAGAGEIMASSTTRDLVGSLDGVQVGEPETVALKGFSDTHQIVLLDWE